MTKKGYNPLPKDLEPPEKQPPPRPPKYQKVEPSEPWPAPPPENTQEKKGFVTCVGFEDRMKPCPYYNMENYRSVCPHYYKLDAKRRLET